MMTTAPLHIDIAGADPRGRTTTYSSETKMKPNSNKAFNSLLKSIKDYTSIGKEVTNV